VAKGRAARPNVELCRDGVQYRLIEEVTVIGESVDKLRQSLASAVDAAKALRRQQVNSRPATHSRHFPKAKLTRTGLFENTK